MWMVLILIVVVAAVIAILWRLDASATRKKDARRAHAWASVAGRRGGQQASGAIEAVVGQSVVSLGTRIVRSGDQWRTHTVARASFSAGAGPKFRVFGESAPTSLTKALGVDDRELGGGVTFDERFVVKCDDVDATRGAWSERARKLMLGVERASVESDGAVVSVTVHTHVEDEAQLEAMLDLAGELASYGARALAELSDLPHARWIPPRGPWDGLEPPRLEIEAPRGTVRIACEGTDSEPALALTIESERELSSFEVAIARGRVEGGAPEGLVPEHARGLVARIGDATLSGDEHRLRLSFASIPPRPIIESAVALAIELAEAQRALGAFR